MKSEKTFKREIAAIFAVLFSYVVISGNVAMAEVIVWPIVSYIAAVSGIHTYKLLLDKPSGSSGKGS